MTEQESNRAKVLRLEAQAQRSETLPYRIELWNDATGNAVERVLARAANATLARAIFKAALTEHPERRITLRRGAKMIADSRSA